MSNNQAVNHPFTSALILASGSGKRMNADIPKQFMLLCGRSILERSIDAFDACKYIDEIIVACRDDDFHTVLGIIARNNWLKPIIPITGDKTRQKSAQRAFSAISGKCEFVAVHDAARCLVKSEDISSVITAAYATGAAIAASPVKDTVKVIRYENTNDNENSSAAKYIEYTPARINTVAAATPQVFRRDIYERAMKESEKSSLEITDDSMMAEAAGIPVSVIFTDDRNFKITTNTDFLLAELMIEKGLL